MKRKSKSDVLRASEVLPSDPSLAKGAGGIYDQTGVAAYLRAMRY